MTSVAERTRKVTTWIRLQVEEEHDFAELGGVWLAEVKRRGMVPAREVVEGGPEIQAFELRTLSDAGLPFRVEPGEPTGWIFIRGDAVMHDAGVIAGRLDGWDQLDDAARASTLANLREAIESKAGGRPGGRPGFVRW